MKLIIYTHIHGGVNSRKSFPKTIHSMYELFKSKGDVDIQWHVMHSGYSIDRLVTDEEFTEMRTEEFIYYHKVYEDSVSLSRARSIMLNDLVCNEPNVYLMNLDMGDELLNIDKLIELVRSYDDWDDLIGFGVKLPDWLDKEGWSFTESYFNKSKSYCTDVTQTAFLFLHNVRLIDEILDSPLNREFKSDDYRDIFEDIRLSISVAELNRLVRRVEISAVQCDFIKINSSDRVLKNTADNRNYHILTTKALKDLGNLHVNSEFYKFNEINKLIKYNPYE